MLLLVVFGRKSVSLLLVQLIVTVSVVAVVCNLNVVGSEQGDPAARLQSVVWEQHQHPLDASLSIP